MSMSGRASGSTDTKGDSQSWLPAWMNFNGPDHFSMSGTTAMEKEDAAAAHHRKLAQLLRYIATLNADGGAGHSFVRQVRNRREPSSFFQLESERENQDDQLSGILFSTEDFRHMLAMETDPATPVFDSPPFSFYAASSAPKGVALGKRMFTGAIKRVITGSADAPGKSCWLRITRLTSTQVTAPPDTSSPAVRQYLEDWRTQLQPPLQSIEQLLTLRHLARAPKLPPSVDMSSSREIKTFLRKYKKYLRKRLFQLSLEPMYNRLFEWIQRQQDHNNELVWGLGHASILSGDTMISGPLLLVLVEVELARDGALLVRPREHTGVTLNREVASALSTANDSGTGSHGVLAQLYSDVAELEPSRMSPGQPSTYTPLLKRISVELSSGGSFQSSSTAARNRAEPGKLSVTEAWCLFSRPKPSSVWARDAMAFADQLLLPNSQGGLVLPQATLALTLGPGALDMVQSGKSHNNTDITSNGLMDLVSSIWTRGGKEKIVGPETPARPLFPLPASEAQNRIADLLINKQNPAVLVEGPPGSGKTQTIANIVCAYLCQGKRVLVTSKNAPALSVLRSRLPSTVQELCVDVSVSELAGMRQLQQTVERLANRVSSVCADVESEKSLLLQRSIDDLDNELRTIDDRLSKHNEKIRQLVQHPDGQKLIQLSLTLIDQVPWLLKSMTRWSLKDVNSLTERVAGLLLEENDSVEGVTGCDMPPSNKLISLVASKAGSSLAIIWNVAREKIAAVPGLGSLSGLKQQSVDLHESLNKLRISGEPAKTATDWKTVLRALEHAQALHSFKEDIWNECEQNDGWPSLDLTLPKEELKQLHTCLEKAATVLRLKWKTGVADEILLAVACQELDSRRTTIALQVQRLAEELVDANVITELSRSFSTEAQSALIRFSQIAGKAKFSRASQPSKMTQRQRRRRQEYLDAFDRCCRFIPCWILTSSQISDYLPAESLFDLVIIDEASQSDVTVLPGMLRGKQWLIVGDGKQVSPTEAFVSEDHIDNLRSTLPTSPLKESFLPGQSFFDLCSQAFPRGRVVLNEHFRCAEEIIEFSNREFYNGRLVPLRLPTRSERLSPSLVDVFVPNGVKVGKVNEPEAEEVVRLVKDFVSHQASNGTPRTIGVISLVGDDQSRLIRGRLLDAIGPQKMALHEILVGDPPTFQGAERDVIILSMVCSPGSVPTQSQLMHAQRANVALSRARDRCILVRSIKINDISSAEDIKIPIIEFFQTANTKTEESNETEPLAMTGGWHSGDVSVRNLLEKVLRARGFSVREMGVVWKNAICVEHEASDSRAAILIEGTGESFPAWHENYKQQKAIERVGWKCLRVDALSLLCDFHVTLESLVQFLRVNGIEEPPVVLYDELEQDHISDVDGSTSIVEEIVEEESHGVANPVAPEAVDPPDVHDVVVISSDDEEDDADKKVAAVKPAPVLSHMDDNDVLHESAFGEVVELSFLRSEIPERASAESYSGDQSGVLEGLLGRAGTKRRTRDKADRYECDESEIEESLSGRSGKKRRRPYKRLDKYARDGRYYPVGKLSVPTGVDVEGTQEGEWYDTDSDLQEGEDEWQEDGNRAKFDGMVPSLPNNSRPHSDDR